METHTHALDIVCKHFRAEFGQEALRTVRAQKSRLSSCNYRLRQKIHKLEKQIIQLTAQNARLLSSHAHILTQNALVQENLKCTLRIVTRQFNRM